MVSYHACILSTFLYGAEPRTTYAPQLKRFHGFHTCLLRKAIGIKWHDKVTNLKVLESQVRNAWIPS